MAQIREDLIIADQFSATFSRFLELGSRIADSFDKLNSKIEEYERKQTRATESTKKASEAKRAYKSYLEQVAEIQGRLNSVTENVTRQNQKFLDHFNKSSSGIEGGIKRIALAFGGFQAVKGLIGLSDQLTYTQARIRGLGGDVEKSMGMIYQSAQRARGNFLDMADSVTKLSVQAPETFRSLPEATRFMEILNKQFKLSGTSADGISSTMYNLTQAMSMGVLRGNDLHMVMSNTPAIVQMIAQEMGVTTGEVKKLAAQNKITADIVKKAIMDAGAEVDAQFSKMPMTFSEAMNKVKNTAVFNFQALQAVISKAINSEEFVSALNAISTGITIATNIAIIGFEKLGAMCKFVADNMNIIGPAVMTVVGAYLLFNATAKITAAVMALQGVLTGVMATAQGMYTAATIAAASGQSAFNAALHACPITWIVTAIFLVIAAVVALIVVFHNLAKTGHTVFGDIAGVVVGLLSVALNVSAMIANGFIAAGEWIANAWNTMVFNLQTFLYNFAVNAVNAFNSVIDGADKAATAIANAFISGANKAIQGINWLIDAINKIPGISIGKMGQIGQVGSVISGRISTSGLVAPTKAAQVSFGRFETQSMGDAWKSGFNKGAAWGDNAQNGLMSKLDGLKHGLSDLTGGSDLSQVAASNNKLADAAGGGGANGGKKNVGSVDKVKSVDNVTLSDEDLKIYRDLAEKRYMARLELQTLAPNISVSIPESAAKNLTSQDVADKLKVMLIEQMASHTALNHSI